MCPLKLETHCSRGNQPVGGKKIGFSLLLSQNFQAFMKKMLKKALLSKSMIDFSWTISKVVQMLCCLFGPRFRVYHPPPIFPFIYLFIYEPLIEYCYILGIVESDK